MIELAYAHAGRRHDQVGLGRHRLLEQAPHGVQRVGRVTEAHWLATGGTHQRVERVRVGAHDLAAGAHFVEPVEVHELVPRPDDRHARLAMHSRGGLTDRREDPDLRRRDRDPAGQRDRTLVQVLAAQPPVLAGVAILHDAYALEPGVGVFHAHHRVGALGERGTGHDARGLAGSEHTRGERPRGDRLDHRQRDRRRCARAEYVRPAHRVAVHRGVGPVRQRDR